jgi:signal transduction histidine kinase
VICKDIVDAHSGKIWLGKSYRGGAAIKFTLPQKGCEDGGDMDTI